MDLKRYFARHPARAIQTVRADPGDAAVFVYSRRCVAEGIEPVAAAGCHSAVWNRQAFGMGLAAGV